MQRNAPTVAALAALLSVPAYAQSADDDTRPEAYSADAAPANWFGLDTDGPEDPLVEVEVSGRAEVVSYDNMDFAELDESTQSAIQDTDDRATFGLTTVGISAFAAPVEGVGAQLRLNAAAAWGESPSSSHVSLAEAFAFARLFETDAFQLTTRVGRQGFSIGGGHRDYWLDGTVDGVTLDAEVVDVLTVRVLGFDLFNPTPRPEDAADFYYQRPSASSPSGQRGEVNTYRFGGVVQTVDQLVEGLDVRAFFFHASVGGAAREGGTGSDITEGGLIGNFRDRDYVQMYGARAGYTGQLSDTLSLGGYAEFARSGGIDRKEATSVDVDLAGNAFGVGIDLEAEFGEGAFTLVADWHRADGAEYSVNGLEFNRGFVSMAGENVGGLASRRLARMRPSAALDTYGVFHAPDTVDRSAGTDTIHASLGLTYLDTELELGFWTYKDTRTSSFPQSTLATVEPPPEHSREEFAAQRRAGLSLGHELEIALRQQVRDFVALRAEAGIFLPGAYYDVPISRAASPVPIEGDGRLGGDATFWAIAVGAEFAIGYGLGR